MPPNAQTLLLTPTQVQDSAKLLAAIAKLFPPHVETEQIAPLSQSFDLFNAQLGSLLSEQKTIPALVQDSARDKQSHSNGDLYLICQGRVRLLSMPVALVPGTPQQQVSVQVIEVGGIWGADSLVWEEPLEYQAIAASPVQIARLPAAQLESWLHQIPQLRTVLQQHTARRQQLIFLKTLTTLRALTSHQIQTLLPHLIEISVPAGTPLAEVTQDGHYWLHRGRVHSTDECSPPPSIGDSWGYPGHTPADWIAATDGSLYKLPAERWKLLAGMLQGKGIPVDSGTAPESADSLRSLNHLPLPERKHRPADSAVTPEKFPLPSPPPPLPSGKLAGSNDVSIASQSSPKQVQFPRPTRRPLRQLWRHYPFVEQQSSSDCGAACLAMISCYWGKQFPLHVLRERANVGRTGASLKNLAKAAESLGFQARPVRASLGRLAEQQNPWIAHWQGEHYIVVYRVRRNRAIIADPALGRRSLSLEEFQEHWSGYALLLEPTERLQETQIKQASLGRYLVALLPYRSLIFQVIVVSILIQAFGLATPLFTQIILDQVVVQKSLTTLNVFAIGLLLFGIWSIGMTSVRQYLLSYFSNRLDLTLVSGFISHTLTLPLKFFESRRVGDILTRVQENQKIQHFIIGQVVLAWLNILTGVVYLGLMLYYNWQLTLLVLGLIPPIVILTLGATPFLRRVSRQIFKEAADQNSVLVEMITGVTTIKSAAAEREMRWRWEDHLTSQMNARFKGQKLGIKLQVANGLVNSFGSTLLLWFGAMLVIQDQLTIGQFVAFNMMMGYVISPVIALANLWDELQEVLISVERLNDVFEADSEEESHQTMLILPPIRGEVRFEDVTFRYGDDEDHNTLQNLSFAVTAGQTIAIVGRSGSGKTSLVKLLQALYYPNRGRVVIDGHDIRHVSPQSLRSQLGVVPQECFLFSGTILENITLYRPEFSLEQAVEVAKLAEAHPFIQLLPLGYSTKVGERGSSLSGGQRQRIAIARALIGNPRILILDEATSSLDTESERRFQRNLAQISRDRTTFIIAHRLSTVRHADRILVLDRGVLAEQGTHDELMQLKGLYYHLAEQQLDL